jgi:hypothetical protein
MHYNDFEKLISRPRLYKYFITCGSNTRKAMVLYRANIRLSQAMFAVLCLFEVVLRNAIDRHYKNTLGAIDRVPREIDHIDSIRYGNLATNLSGISLST